MSEDVEVTEDGEIVASNSGDDLRAGPDVDGWWRVCVSSYEYAAVCLPTPTIAAWCRRVLREVDPDPVPTVDEAAIRADERAIVAGMIDSMAGELSWRNHLHHVLRMLADDIRAGKHRRTA